MMSEEMLLFSANCRPEGVWMASPTRRYSGQQLLSYFLSVRGTDSKDRAFQSRN